MAAQCGSAIVLSIENNEGTPAYEAVGGLRSRNISFNAETVDITNAGSSNKWREFLDTCGTLSASISGDGVFVDDSAQAEVNEAFLAGSNRNWKILIPDFGEFEGLFRITSLEFGGDFNAEVTFSLTIESAGAVTFTTV